MEQRAFEQNWFELDDGGGAADALRAREQALVNALHAEARFGAWVAAAVSERCASVLAGVEQRIQRCFAEAGGAAPDAAISRVRASVIGTGFWAAVDGRAGVRGPAAAAVLGDQPQRVAARVPSMLTGKRARSDETGMAPLPPPQPPSPSSSADAGMVDTATAAASEFVTARHQMRLDNVKRHGLGQGAAEGGSSQQHGQYRPGGQRSGAAQAPGRRIVRPAPPLPGRRAAAASDDDMDDGGRISDPYFAGGASGSSSSLATRLQRPRAGLKRGAQALHQRKDGPQQQQQQPAESPEVDERLRNIEPRM
ncbi:hypothetical protein H4R19_003749, partial [Coemansia spiralis]